MEAKSESQVLWRRDGVSITRFRYHAERYEWGDSYSVPHHAVALPRYGAFRRRSGGIEHLVDQNSGFYCRESEEVQVANFTGEPEEMTLIKLSTDVLEQLFTDGDLPTGPFRIAPQLNLAHLELLASLPNGDDARIEEHALGVVVEAVRQCRASLVRGSRLRTQQLQRRLVSDACELLYVTRGSESLQRMAKRLGASPFHLSRVFQAVTGCSLSQYRLRHRVNEVLGHLANGCDDLASIALDVGFADHSHMTRSIRAQLGESPTALRDRFDSLAAHSDRVDREAQADIITLGNAAAT